MSRREREAHRRTNTDLLQTTPAGAAEPSVRANGEEMIGDLDFDWRPQPLERVFTSDRSFRWPIIGGALVLAAVAIIAVRGLGTISDAQAEERLADYRSALDTFSTSLEELDTALPDIDLEGALAFSVATETLRAAAEEDLPGLPPFVPQGSLGDVETARDRLREIVDAAMLVSADLDIAAGYATASESLFGVPPLPSSAPPELLDPASEAIADMQTETLATLAGLEPDERFDQYVVRVQEALDDLPDWTDRYLLALRSGDTETADTLIVAIGAQRQLLEAELDVALGRVGETVKSRIDEIRTAVTDAEVLTASG